MLLLTGVFCQEYHNAPEDKKNADIREGSPRGYLSGNFGSRKRIENHHVDMYSSGFRVPTVRRTREDVLEGFELEFRRLERRGGGKSRAIAPTSTCVWR